MPYLSALTLGVFISAGLLATDAAYAASTQQNKTKAKAKAKKAAKKSDAEYKAERKEIVDAARKALKDIRDNPQSSAAPLFRELVAIAPHVKKFMESVANNTADKFDNILTDIHAEFKEEEPNDNSYQAGDSLNSKDDKFLDTGFEYFHK